MRVAWRGPCGIIRRRGSRDRGAARSCSPAGLAPGLGLPSWVGHVVPCSRGIRELTLATIRATVAASVQDRRVPFAFPSSAGDAVVPRSPTTLLGAWPVRGSRPAIPRRACPGGDAPHERLRDPRRRAGVEWLAQDRPVSRTPPARARKPASTERAPSRRFAASSSAGSCSGPPGAGRSGPGRGARHDVDLDPSNPVEFVRGFVGRTVAGKSTLVSLLRPGPRPTKRLGSPPLAASGARAARRATGGPWGMRAEARRVDRPAPSARTCGLGGLPHRGTRLTSRRSLRSVGPGRPRFREHRVAVPGGQLQRLAIGAAMARRPGPAHLRRVGRPIARRGRGAPRFL